MRFAFEGYALGDWTVRSLLEELTDRGLKTRPCKTRPGQALAPAHFHRLLTHPYYKGIVRYRGVEYPGQHEPLVSPELWQRVQDRLHAQASSGEKQRIHLHYLKGSVFCGQCGSRLIITMSVGRHGKLYPYFICLGRQQRRTDCTQRAMRIDRVEALVERAYGRLRLSEAERSLASQTIRQMLAENQAATEAERVRQTTRRNQLLTERAKLLQAHYASAIPLDLMRSEQDRISHELEATEQRLSKAEANTEQVLTNLDRTLDLLADPARTYCQMADEQRRWSNQAYFKRLEIKDDDTVVATLSEPFALLVDEVIIVREGNDDLERALCPAPDRPWRAGAAIAPYSRSRSVARRPTTNPRTVGTAGGLNMDLMVRLEGLEPPTF